MQSMTETIFTRNNIKVTGSGTTPMIFAHGFGCDQNMWRYIWPAFEKDYKIVLFDYVGSGKSDLTAYNSEKYADLNGYADDVIDVCKATNSSGCVFVGHSVSAIIGILASLKEPELFSKLILVGPSPRYINDLPEYIGGFERKDIEELLHTMEANYIGWANFLAPAIMKNNDRPELAAELEESFCSTDPVIARRFAEATFFSDNRQDLKKVKHPSLIMQCSEDIIAPTEVGEYLHKNIPDSTLKIMKATGHCPHMSAPEETIQLMKEYLGNINLN
jgi:sigma-B regulation protein RsbQ